MAARAMWKATIVAGDLTVPVKLYAAVQDRSVHFRLLHEQDMAPVVQKMVDPRTNKPVDDGDVRKGFEVEPGVFVLLTEEDEEALAPPDSREIVIEQVLPRLSVDDRWYDRPYFLGPDGDAGTYFALTEALGGPDQIGVARWTMRKQRYAGALHAADGYLMLETLRHEGEVLQVEPLKTPQDRVPDPRELALAEQLVSALRDDFDPDVFRDEYREKLLELIELKGSGKIVKMPRQRKPKPEHSLLESLEASLKETAKARAS